jgi:hypothetical protein
VNSVDPIVHVLADLDRPARPTVEFQDALLVRLLAELCPTAEPQARDRRPWHIHRLPGVPWRRSGRRRVLALVAGLLVVAVVTASAIGSVRDFVLDRGFLGLPPEGATPSAPEGGELVLQGKARSASVANSLKEPGGRYVGALVRLWVFADGRVIWDRLERRVSEGAKELESGLLEQRLTPEGVELVRSEFVASGLFDRDLTLVVPDGHLFPEGGNFWGWAEAPRDGRLVRLRWDSPLFSSPGKRATATPEQVSALRRLDALLGDPESVLPSSAWAVRKIRAYVPSHYSVCVTTAPPMGIAPLLSRLPVRAEKLLRDQSWTRSESDVVEAREGGVIVVLGRSVSYCSEVPTEKAREVADALSGLEPDTDGRTNGLAYVVAEPVGLTSTAIGLEPLLPHGESPRNGG